MAALGRKAGQRVWLVRDVRHWDSASGRRGVLDMVAHDVEKATSHPALEVVRICLCGLGLNLLPSKIAVCSSFLCTGGGAADE